MYSPKLSLEECLAELKKMISKENPFDVFESDAVVIGRGGGGCVEKRKRK
jgi:hypothetical protein